MKNVWSTVTTASKWGMVLAFLVVLPVLSFLIGRLYERTISDFAHVESLTENTSRMFYTDRAHGIRIEFPSAWQSYDVAEAIPDDVFSTLFHLDGIRAYQFYTPTVDPRYARGDTESMAKLLNKNDWQEPLMGKYAVFELLIFPKEEWTSVQKKYMDNKEALTLGGNTTNSLVGDQYAYIFLGRKEYPTDIADYLFTPSVRDIHLLHETTQ